MEADYGLPWNLNTLWQYGTTRGSRGGVALIGPSIRWEEWASRAADEDNPHPDIRRNCGGNLPMGMGTNFPSNNINLFFTRREIYSKSW